MNDLGGRSYAEVNYIMRKENAKWPQRLVPVPEASWPPASSNKRPRAVFRSRDYLVQEFSEIDGVIRLSICRTTIKKCGAWDDDITWDELQKIKRQCGYGDRTAVEVFPPDGDIVNVANMRHLWVLPDDLPFAWRRR